jgi:hypothetical protein
VVWEENKANVFKLSMKHNYQVNEYALLLRDNKIYPVKIIGVDKRKITVLERTITINVYHPCRLKRYEDETVCLGLGPNFSQRWYDGDQLKQLRAPAKDWYRAYCWSGDG